MKMFKKIVALLLLAAVLATTVGCYMVSGQKMKTVKGTYKLTGYTYTPSYERREGYTPRTYNYVEDEDYKYEDYLVVTGTSTGYYIHKDANNPAYVKEVALSYEYSTEDSSKVEYVIYNDVLTAGNNTGVNRLGVTKNNLNYSKPGFDFTQLFTGKAMRSEDISVRWEKVDKATDLSYVQAQLGSLKRYTYQGFGVRGIYELDSGAEISTGTVLESKYQYFYYVIDTAEGATSVTAHYALKETPTEKVQRTLTVAHSEGDWSQITIDGVLWTADPSWGRYFRGETEGVRYTLSCVSNDISDNMLESMISSRLPAQE